MTQIHKFVALGAAVVGLALCQSGLAQDDLDDLLKDLESDAAEATPAKPAEAKAEETPAAEESAEDTSTQESADGSSAEEPAKSEDEKAEEKSDDQASADDSSAEESTDEKAEEATDEKAEEKSDAEESADGSSAEESEKSDAEEATDEKTEEPAKAEEPATVSNEKVDEVLGLLDSLAAESGEKPTVAAEGSTSEQAKPESVAKPEPVVAKKPVAKPNPEAELLSNIMTTERVRRQALDAQAKREIGEARLCMKNAEYSEAVRHYGNAAKLLNDRRAAAPFRKECDQGMAEGLYRAALQENALGRHEQALELMNQAVEMRHPRARRMIEKWADEEAANTGVEDRLAYRHVKAEEANVREREQIRKHLKRSVQFLANSKMEKALEECEIVLKNDPYNQQAIRIRKAIQKKRQTILKQERDAARDGMIADVDEAWRPVYAVNASQLNSQSAETVKAQTGDDPERTMEQDIERRMKEMKLPNISFKPPATIIDAVEFFRQASKDYDRPDIPAEKRGFNFVLRTPVGAIKQQAAAEESDDFSSSGDEDNSTPTNGLEPIQTITASDITFHEALKLVCDSVGYKFIVRGQVVMVMPFDMSTAELIARKYNVPEAFVERVNNAKDEIKTMGGFGSNNSSRSKKSDEEEGEEQDWKAFFEEMGVKWPEGSSIKHIKALGKLYVRNTRENLAEFEKVLDELGGQPQLIEIETRFVEVSQEDLNSLGFEWLLNSDYSLDLGSKLGKALGVKKTAWGSAQGTRTWSSSGETSAATGMTTSMAGKPIPMDGFPAGINTPLVNSQTFKGEQYNNSTTIDSYSQGGNLIRHNSGKRNLGINAFGGTSEQANNNRYLSTLSNHISGESKSTNDQFMRVNAFLGNADLSMILHMLSQRSDTDLLSAPKIVTKSGENAVIKVVTEYIYPQDYDVQLQSSSSSSGGSSGGGSQSAVLAVVEPQNFTMREVGVILDVTPTYSEANGGTIDLELKPQVVDEPTWKNYGMKIPFTGNSSLENFEGIGGIFEGLAQSITAIGGGISDELKSWIITTETEAAKDALNGLTRSQSDNMTYYDAPMEQPFFHVRSIDSKVSITPGATVVMGGLITEQRKAMDDKIPFLGDLPYIGRLFRSHAEMTNKRNLLIFVTGRLITPSGRELKMNEQQTDDAEVKAAPSAE